MKTKLIQTDLYLLLVDEEAEIKDCYYYNSLDKELRKNNNLNHSYHHKVVAYYPLTKEAKEFDLPLLPNPFENEVNIEKLAINSFGHKPTKDDNDIILSLGKGYIKGFQAGYKAAQQSDKKFSLEEVKKAIDRAYCIGYYDKKINEHCHLGIKREEEIIQSLSTQRLPKFFIPEYINTNSFGSETNGYDSGNFILKTITNSEGKEEIVGTYKF